MVFSFFEFNSYPFDFSNTSFVKDLYIINSISTVYSAPYINLYEDLIVLNSLDVHVLVLDWEMKDFFMRSKNSFTQNFSFVIYNLSYNPLFKHRLVQEND